MSIQNINASNAAMDTQLARMASQQTAASGQRSATSASAQQTPPSEAARADPANKQSAAEPDRATLLQAVEEVQKAIAPVAQNLLFSIDNDTGRTIVKIVDSQTDEVIRQMPSEEVLAISKAIDKLKGVLIQQKA